MRSSTAPPESGETTLVCHHAAGHQILLACPDSRPPAYEAAVGLSDAGLLGAFETSFYFGSQSRVIDRLVATLPSRLKGRLSRRSHPEIPGSRVISHPEVDLALAAENRIKTASRRRKLSQWRAEYFDRQLRRQVERDHPAAVFLFSDVGSGQTLPHCRKLGIPTIVSVVHGDPAEEQDLLKREADRSPEYFPLYLGDGDIDLTELEWLHQRRQADRNLATLLLVPSLHIAERLQAQNIPEERIRVIPYAADVNRFRPRPHSQPRPGCQFVFAGGITQRKGISYLLQAWRMIQRPGWSLHLVGALPRKLGPLQADLDQPGIVWRGRVAHSEMPALLSDSDVFVFPSLFEGSAVVTYEALAAGLPEVVTREAGSVVRDGREGLIVPAGDPGTLAEKMERLGTDIELRAEMATAARKRGEEFNWLRYRQSVAEAVLSLVPSSCSANPFRESLAPRKG